MKKFKMRLYRAYNNVYGKLGGAFLCGGVLAICCGALPIGLTLLSFSGLSLLFCAGQLHLEDRELASAEKYFPEPEAEDYLAEETEKEQELNFDKVEVKTLNNKELTR